MFDTPFPKDFKGRKTMCSAGVLFDKLTKEQIAILTERAIHEAELDTFKNAVDIREILSLCDFTCARCKRSDVKHHSFGFCGRCARREKSGKPDSDIKTPLKSDDYFECSKCGSIKKFKRVRDLCNLCNNRKYYAEFKS